MYASFYVWHGVFLNDLNHINFSKPLFFVLVALVYFVISYVLYRTYEVKLLDKYFSNAVFKGVVAGTIVGFFLFAVVAVLGVSFTKQVNTTYLLADCIWQVVEQIIGGVVIGFGKLFIFEPTHDMRHAD
jgi:H+/Cl- antiporter ClcA